MILSGLNRQLLVHAANDKIFRPNQIVFSPPSGHIPQHDGVDNAPVFTAQKPQGILQPTNTARPNGIKNVFLGMFARKADQQ